MARDHARLRLDIWGDDDWRKLTPPAQHLYFALWTSPTLTFCGVDDWRPGKIAARSKGWDAHAVEMAGAELSSELFLVIDENTEEVLIRSWIKHDGLFRVPNMAVSMANARSSAESQTIRGVIVHEVLKLRDKEPELSGWSRDAVASMLKQTPINPSAIPCFNPRYNPAANPDSNPWVNPTLNPMANQGPTPSPAPTPTPTTKREAPQRGTRLPENWMPDAETIAWAKSEYPNVDLKTAHESFTNHWLSKSGKDATKIDWNRTWRNWIIKEPSFTGPKSNSKPTAGNTTAAVDGWMNIMNDDHEQGELG